MLPSFGLLLILKNYNMGKLKSFIKLEGTLDGLTFYKSQDGYMVRTKGGVSKSRIMKDPAFKRTRENLLEFASNARAGKFIRQSVGTKLNKGKDSKLSSRMLKLMNEIKNFDQTSARGHRVVGNGLTTTEGKQLLKGFNFNNRAHLQSVLLADFSVNTTTGEISIPEFICSEQLFYPENATHVGFSAGISKLDFDNQLSETSFSNTTLLPINMDTNSISLEPLEPPTNSGIQLQFLLLEFSQEINGIQYPLLNGAHNSLCIVEVI